ncbi:hypothetical protein BNJ_00085 [Kaumoebavirus]|uniref:hypothetical protein n=1 Tax=Kaumoebavirus TaxID=1859492 RepID=UPI0009C3DB23|nr:hypothetical protein BNJ_00085 [Kaumoebavirus]ARA71925.1 hypothetical protein BNJ_00085 [Kaumoebavirus]
MNTNNTMQHYKRKEAPNGIYFEQVNDFCIKCKEGGDSGVICDECVNGNKKYFLARMFKKCYICNSPAYYSYFCDPCLRYNSMYYENGDWIKPADRVHPVPNILTLLTWSKKILNKGATYVVKQRDRSSYSGWCHWAKVFTISEEHLKMYPEEFERVNPPNFPQLFQGEEEGEKEDVNKEDREEKDGEDEGGYNPPLSIVGGEGEDLISQLLKHGVKLEFFVYAKHPYNAQD